MKILFVNNFRNRGGGEEFLRDLLPGLVERGVEVGLVCRPGTPLVEMFRSSSVRLFPVQSTSYHRLTAAIKTARNIRDHSYDLVCITRGHDIAQGWLGSVFSGRKPKLVYTVQVPEFLQSRFLLSRMDGITTISRFIRDELKRFDSRLGETVRIIHYGIDVDSFASGKEERGDIRKRFGVSTDAPLIGSVGALWKNQSEFLDALVMIRNEFPAARFAVTAEDDGSDHAAAFKARAAELGLLDALVWLGRLAKEDVRRLYLDMDVAVNMNRREGFGIWLLEAMASGVPVVSVNAGGAVDAIEGCKAGLLVSGGPEEMSQAVLSILKDPDRRRILLETARAWTHERFAKKRMIDDYYRYYTSLLV